MGRQPRMHSLSQWSFTKQTKNKTHINQMASFSRWNPRRQHKDNKNQHIIQHIWHTDKTTGDIKIEGFAQIPHGMVKSLIAFACGECLWDSHGTQKGIRMILHERNISLEFLRTVTSQREGVSCWLVGVRIVPDYQPSWLVEHPCEFRCDTCVIVTYAYQWRCHTAVQDRSSSDPTPFSLLLLILYRITYSLLYFITTLLLLLINTHIFFQRVIFLLKLFDERLHILYKATLAIASALGVLSFLPSYHHYFLPTCHHHACLHPSTRQSHNSHHNSQCHNTLDTSP
jgi:hypothetical protein